MACKTFPPSGLFDGSIRVGLEETGMGYGLEVDMIAEAHKLDMLTCPYVFDPDSARAMAEAGADVLGAAYGFDDKRGDWGDNGAHFSGFGQTSTGYAGCGRTGQSRYYCALPRRPHR